MGHDLSYLAALCVAGAIGADYPFTDDPRAMLDYHQKCEFMGLLVAANTQSILSYWPSYDLQRFCAVHLLEQKDVHVHCLCVCIFNVFWVMVRARIFAMFIGFGFDFIFLFQCHAMRSFDLSIFFVCVYCFFLCVCVCCVFSCRSLFLSAPVLNCRVSFFGLSFFLASRVLTSICEHCFCDFFFAICFLRIFFCEYFF